MAMENGGALFKTPDLYYAAYLKVAKVKLEGTEKQGNRVFFVFERTEMLKKLELEYYNRISKVSALDYADEIKVMKSLTHSR